VAGGSASMSSVPFARQAIVSCEIGHSILSRREMF
jgi:hypothetical protein